MRVAKHILTNGGLDGAAQEAVRLAWYLLSMGKLTKGMCILEVALRPGFTTCHVERLWWLAWFAHGSWLFSPRGITNGRHESVMESTTSQRYVHWRLSCAINIRSSWCVLSFESWSDSSTVPGGRQPKFSNTGRGASSTASTKPRCLIFLPLVGHRRREAA